MCKYIHSLTFKRLKLKQLRSIHESLQSNMDYWRYLLKRIISVCIEMITISWIQPNNWLTMNFLHRKKIKNQVIEEIHKAKYFSLRIDSIPDVSHVDWVVFCVRYVNNEEPVERFLSFISNEAIEHTSTVLKDTVVTFLI